MIEAMGGITTVRLLHRYAAVILILGSFIMCSWRLPLVCEGERIRIMLRPKDAVDIYERLNII